MAPKISIDVTEYTDHTASNMRILSTTIILLFDSSDLMSNNLESDAGGLLGL